jgi:serine/threonine protein phosphatase PrpC
MLMSYDDEMARCRSLVDAANASGGADNVTVVLARLLIEQHGDPSEQR